MPAHRSPSIPSCIVGDHDSLLFVEIPIRDISVHALAADLAVCPERGNFILDLVVSFLNWTEILIGIAPGIFRKLREVSSELPFFSGSRRRRAFQ